VTECLQPVSVSRVPCTACGEWAERQIALPARPVLDAPPYYDVGLDAVITSRAQRRRLMREQGVVERGTTAMHGTKGTVFSQGGRPAVSVPKSGAYLGPEWV
jgi:hypothetical protein